MRKKTEKTFKSTDSILLMPGNYLKITYLLNLISAKHMEKIGG